MSMLVAMFSGTAYALPSAATNTTNGAVGVASPSDAPTYTWAGSSFSVDLSITTDATSNSKQYSLIDDGGVCTLSDSDTVSVTGVGECVVIGRVAAGNGYLSSIDEMIITTTKATQATFTALTNGTDGATVTYHPTVSPTVTLSSSGGSGGGAVTFAKVSGSCDVADTTATITGMTACVIEATSAASANYLVATDQATITITKATQATFTALTDGADGTSVLNGATVTLSSSGGSGGGAVTFAKISGDCTVVGTTATITGKANDCIVEATSATSTNYLVATDRVTISMIQDFPTTSSVPLISVNRGSGTVTDAGTWNARGGTLGVISYQWYQCTGAHLALNASESLVLKNDCRLIAGATTAYVAKLKGTDRYVRVLVTRSNGVGSGYAWSVTIRR